MSTSSAPAPRSRSSPPHKHPLATWLKAKGRYAKRDFAASDGCSVQFIDYVVTGKAHPGPVRAKRWSQKTGIPLEVFLFYNGRWRKRR
jgi:hypothetical protein